MSEQHRSGRLDAATLAAYVDGQLPPEARARVEAEIAVEPESYEWVVNAIGVAEELDAAGEAPAGCESGAVTPSGSHGAAINLTPDHLAPAPDRPAPAMAPMPVHELRPAPAPTAVPPRVIPFYKRRRVQAGSGALLAAAAALLLVVWLPLRVTRTIGPSNRELTQPGVDDVNPHFARLVAAVGEERDIEGRLTGGFDYRALRSATRGPGDLSNPNLTLLAAAGELRKAAQENMTAENLHAWGVAQLLLGNRESLDGSIESLTSAVTLSGAAGIRSDLAAAYIQRFRVAGELGDIRRALEESERALAMDPALSPAAFNRAVALELRGTVAEAISAWEDYASTREPDGWTAEASRRLNELRH
jgi:anti-sigma factor RsiW